MKNNKTKTPAFFVGHGSPMSAMAGNVWRNQWKEFGKKLSKPKAILVISAHWNIAQTAVSDLTQPKQIFDFYGFPEELYEVKYDVHGSSEIAELVRETLSSVADVKINNEWGIDHGTWIPLKSIFPEADVPVLQLSIDYSKPAKFHYELGKALRPLREKGIMIVGSGDIVHNLRQLEYQEDAEPFVWAKKFEEKVLKLIDERKHTELVEYNKLGNDSKLAIPTPEHYLPLLYILALQNDEEKVEYFAKGIAHGSISMTSFVLR